MTFDDAVTAGLFDRIAPSSSQLIQTAKEWLAERRAGGGMRRDGAPSRWIGRPDIKSRVLGAFVQIRGQLPQTPSGAAVIRAITAGLEDGWGAALNEERRSLVKLRHENAARAALKAFFERGSGKSA
jgi:enoyl-CoA hydratase/carnithine racemase